MSREDLNDFGFIRDFTIPVYDSLGDLFTQPWVGGMNSCQFSEIDLDRDGIKDLLVFDRHGNRIMPFINNTKCLGSQYTYAPEYIIKFPYLHDWVNLVDYNCDGLEDIFTYTTGGIRVYKNVSDCCDLKFEMVESILYSFYYNGYVNLFALVDDYPAFTDIDGDGDMDILNFWTLGKYVNYHKNLSMEKYGNCDSLDFILTAECWGYFEESEASNVLTLNISCGQDEDSYIPPDGGNRHSGSSLLAIDLDGDADKDVIIGDVDYPNLVGLINGGTADSAYMISQDTLFPSNTKFQIPNSKQIPNTKYKISNTRTRPVDLMSLPATQYLDLDNDGIKDLIVSPSDPSYDRAENYQSVWLYKNTGTDTSPIFEYYQNDFLQGEMIDVGGGAYPVVYDVDGDGLEDLLIGNFGYLDSTYYSFGYLYFIYRSQIAYFKNTGTAGAPAYKLINSDFAEIASLSIQGACPAMADLDGDNDADMLVGNADGTLYYFENLAGQGNTPVFARLVQNYQNIDVGHYSTPQLIDLNRDGLVDLVIGNKEGTLSFYANTGTAQDPLFTFITGKLGGVDVNNPNLSLAGYSVPCFFDMNGEYRLFVGSEFGGIFYYKDIDGNLDGQFTLVDPHLLYISEGYRTGVTIFNYNSDQYPDMIIGNWAGGVALYKGVTPSPADMEEKTGTAAITMKVFPNPAGNIITVILDGMSQAKSSELHVSDVFGREVKVIDVGRDQGEMQIDASGLKPGVYFIYLVMDGVKAGGGKIIMK
ncbi:MAG: FG-GAP-like repeat-containing protein [Bacteroidetes bacterium]|nr:FG-GAP-like repeat-containing protein [Bacteroidota bacterium]